MEIAVIVVDVINDFVSGVLGTKRALGIIPNIRRLLGFARERGVSVIYTNDSHVPSVDKEFEIWPPHAIAGTWGAQVVDELKPEEGDYVLKKKRYSAFFGTDLDMLLRELGVGTLTLVGLVTHICIQHTAADAFFRGYHVVIPEDCVEAPTGETHKSAIEFMKVNYGCEITSSGELIRKMEA